ncbi:MAG TPA: hypothetical protein VN661_09425 [Candidatus Acidoferrales bacterium]|nr:hypothetical protein [Candidatus Acidoferrales bacterium]
MRKIFVLIAMAAASVFICPAGKARQGSSSGPYKVLRTAKVGGDGFFDYVYADVAGRKLYIPRMGQGGRITVFNLDTLQPLGEIPNTSGHGAAVDPASGHGFATSKPVAMWDTTTLKLIKTIDVDGGPDGILFDPFNERVYIFSHRAPNATVINAKDGTVAGTIDLGGAPEEAVTDSKGHLFVDLEDKNSIAAVDAATMKVTATYDISSKCGGPAGLAFDVKNHVLFAACRDPHNMVILNAEDGKIITTLPIGNGTDGATFNPDTMEAFSSQRDGTLTIVKENSPTDFTVEQTVQTMPGAKTLTLDSKTGHILLISAQFAPPPAAPAGGAGGGRFRRGALVPGSFSILVVGK